jgi:predicted Rossmann fold flavoprotein
MKNKQDIVIIGGGPAGMVAAIVAARKGARVLVIERMPRVGKKLLVTGNNRCNIANRKVGTSRFHGANPDFISEPFRQFGLDATLSFFEELGIPTRAESDGRIFPTCNQASSVLDALRYEMDDLGVQTVCDQKVQRVEVEPAGFNCVCVDGAEFYAERIIVATGGKSTPNLGSNGGGFKIAKALGHRLVEPVPALVQLTLDVPFLKRLKGLKFHAEAELRINGEPDRAERGEILFTETGISGIPILQLSRTASEHVNTESSGKDTSLEVRLDLLPTVDADALTALLNDRIGRKPNRSIEATLLGLIHKRLIYVILREAKLDDPKVAASTLNEKAVGRIVAALKGWRLPCTGTETWMSSQVTAGGVAVNEIDPETMQSTLVPGAYFAGEVIDIDGDCGGHNLQWAWSSGFVAGVHASV